MARNDDLTSQLSIQQQINKVLQQRQQMLQSQAKTLGSQAKLAAELCKALECKDLEGLEARIKGINDTLGQAADSAEQAGQSMGSMSDATEKTSEKVESLSTKIQQFAVGIGLVKGLQQAFSGTVKTMTGFGKGVMSIVGSIWKLSMAILSIPLKIYEGLIGMAQQGGGGPDPVKVQLEEIREQFGSLATNEGKAFVNITAKLQRSFKGLGVGGKSLARLFGYGRGGLAEALKAAQEIATEIGPVFSRMYTVFEKNAEAILKYQKGLKFSSKTMGAIIKQAYRMNEVLTDKEGKGVFNRLTKEAKTFADKYKMNHEGVTKAMDDLIQMDYRFQMQAVKAPGKLAAVATKVRLLGIEAKELKGIIDTWDNWDSAIQATSDLGAMFGMNIDAVQMMNASDAERLQLMEEQVKMAVASGKLDINDPKHLKNLAEATKMQEDTIVALAKARKGEDLKSIEKGQKEQEKRTMSQAEAMKYLADSMKRVFGGGGGSQFKGFMDAFMKGFGKGIQRSHEFRKIMRNIRKSLRVVYRAGKEVGKMFVKLFPGVKRMFTGLGSLFDPKRFSILMSKVKAIFRKFFIDVRTDPKAGVESFVKRMKEVFKNFFGGTGGAVKDVAQGGKLFLKTLWGIFKAALFMIVPEITKGLKTIADLIRNPPEINSAFGTMMMALWTELKDVFGQLFSMLGPPLLEALLSLFDALWAQAGPYIKKGLEVFGTYLLAKALFTVFVNVAKSALVGKGIAFLFKKIASMMNISMPDAPEQTPEQIRQAAEARVAPFGGIIDGIGNIDTQQINAAKDTLKDLTTKFVPWFALFLTSLMLSLIPALLAIAVVGPTKFAVAVGGTVGMVWSFVALFQALKGITPSDADNAGKMLRTMALKFVVLGFAPFMLALAGVSLIFSMMPVQVLLGMIPVFLGMAAISIALGGLMFVLSKLDGRQVNKAVANLNRMVPVLLPLTLFAAAFGLLAVGLAAAGITPVMAGVTTAILLGVAASIWAISQIVVPASSIPQGLMGKAVIGIALAAVLATVIGGAFAAAVWLLSGTTDLPWEKVGNAFGQIAKMMIAVAIVAGVGAGIAVLLGGAQGLLIAAGILGAAALIWVLGHEFAWATNSFAENLQFGAVAKTAIGLVSVAVMMVELIAIAAIAAIGAIPFVLGAIGIGFAAVFVAALSSSGFLKNLVSVGENSGGLGKFKGNFEGLSIAIDAIMKVADAADRLHSFWPTWLGADSAQEMVDRVKGFLTAMTEGTPSFMDSLKALATGTSGDPAGFKTNAEAIGLAIDPIIRMIEASAALGAIEDGVFSDTTSPETFAGIHSVVSALLGGIGPIINDLMTGVQGLGNIDTAKVQAMASMVGGLADVVGALAEPLAKIGESASKQRGNYHDKNRIKKFTESISGAASAILISLKTHAVQMIGDLIAINVPGDPAVAKKKMEVMVDAMKILGIMSDALSKNVDMLTKMLAAQDKASDWGDSGPKLGDMIGNLRVLIETLMPSMKKHIPEIIKGLMGAVPAGAGEDMKARMDAVVTAVKGIGEAITLIPKLLDVMPEDIVNDPEKINERVTLYFGPPDDPTQGLVYQMIVPMASAIGESIKLMLAGTASITDPKQLEPRMKIVSDAVSAIGTIGKLAVDMMGVGGGSPNPTAGQLEKIVEAGMAEDICKKAKKVKDSITMIMGALGSPESGIASVIGSILALTENDALKKASAGANIKIVGDALGVAANFVKVIKDVTGLVPKAISGEDLYNKMTWIVGEGFKTESVFSMIAKSLSTHLPTVVDAILAIKVPEGMDKSKIDIISKSLEAVAHFADAISSLVGTFAGGKKLDAATAVELIDALFGPRTDGNSTLQSPIGMITGAIETHLPPLIDSIAGIKIGSKTHTTRLKNVVAALDAVVKFSDAISTINTAFGGSGEKLVDTGYSTEVVQTEFPKMADTVDALILHMPRLVGGIVKIAQDQGATVGRNLTNIARIGKIFPMIKNFAEAMNSIKGLQISGKSILQSVLSIAEVFDPKAVVNTDGKSAVGYIASKISALGEKGEIDVAKIKVASTGFYYLNAALNRAVTLGTTGGAMVPSVYTNIADSITNIEGTPKKMETMFENAVWKKKDIPTKALHLQEAITNIEAGVSGVSSLAQPERIANIMHSIATMDGLLDGTMGDGAVTVIGAFTAGQLNVTHNIPNTELKIRVDLSAKQIAEGVVKVNMGGGKTIKATGAGG